jgi:hypothetical protein
MTGPTSGHVKQSVLQFTDLAAELNDQACLPVDLYQLVAYRTLQVGNPSRGPTGSMRPLLRVSASRDSGQHIQLSSRNLNRQKQVRADCGEC